MRNDLVAASAANKVSAKVNASARPSSSAMDTARGPLKAPQLVPNTARPGGGGGGGGSGGGGGGGGGYGGKTVRDDRTVYGHFKSGSQGCEKMKLKWVMEERKKNHHLNEVLTLIRRDEKRYGMR